MQTKNLIIDARIVDLHLHGISRYATEIITRLSNNNFHIYLLVNNENLSKQIFGDNFEYIKMKSRFLSLKEQIELPKIVNSFKKENTVFYSPSYVCSPLIKCKYYFTIHDLIHLNFKPYATLFRIVYYNLIVKSAAKHAHKIFTVSKFSKKEILKWLKCNKDKVIITYNGIDPIFHRVTDSRLLTQMRQKFNLPNEFILYVGNFKPHKNVSSLVEAMSKIKSDVKLVMAGIETQELSKIIEFYKLQNKIQFIGYVDDDELPILYSLARLFVFPSVYEGFGLPPIEAMACGCPVVVSNRTSLPEIIKDPQFMVDTINSSTLAVKIDDMLQSTYIDCKDIELKLYDWDKTVAVIENFFLES